MKTLICSFIALLILPIAAENPASTDFLRVNRDAKAVQLQTGVTRYQKDEATVDLIGAVHIADAKYYKQLNTEFTQYESLLFEMVGGVDAKEVQSGEG